MGTEPCKLSTSLCAHTHAQLLFLALRRPLCFSSTSCKPYLMSVRAGRKMCSLIISQHKHHVSAASVCPVSLGLTPQLLLPHFNQWFHIFVPHWLGLSDQQTEHLLPVLSHTLTTQAHHGFEEQMWEEGNVCSLVWCCAAAPEVFLQITCRAVAYLNSDQHKTKLSSLLCWLSH